jgi:transposase-like protein
LTLSAQFSLVISEALFVKRLKPCKLFVCDMEKRSCYSASFKLKVIDFAEKHGNRAAGREFSVTEFNVRDWRKQKLALQNTYKWRKAFRGPKSGKFPELDDELLEYVLDLRKDGCGV